MSSIVNHESASFSEEGNEDSEGSIASPDPSLTEFVERMLSRPPSLVSLVHPAIARIKSENKIQGNSFIVHPNQEPGTTSPDAAEVMQRRPNDFLWNRVLTNPTAIDAGVDDLIRQGPPIEYSRPKPNPTGPYGIGISIPGEKKQCKDLSRILSKEDMTAGLLHFFSKDVETGRLQFTTFIGRNLCLSDISLLNNYKNLRYIYLAKNRIVDMKPFQQMEHLILVDLDENKISCYEQSGDVPEIPSLEILSLSGNRFTQLEGLPKNNYIYLNLNFNQLKWLGEMNVLTFANLITLEIRCNRIKSLGNFYLPRLKHLWAADNELTSLGELKGCPALISFHARGNQITDISNFPIGLLKLDYINLRDNGILKLAPFRFVGRSPIKAMILIGNECRRVNNYRMELIACIPTLLRLDKTLVTTCDLEAARYLRQGREDRSLLPFVDRVLPITATPPPSPREAECVTLLAVEKHPVLWEKIHTDPPRNMKEKVKKVIESEVVGEMEDSIDTYVSENMKKKKNLSMDKSEQIRDGVQKLSL